MSEQSCQCALNRLFQTALHTAEAVGIGGNVMTRGNGGAQVHVFGGQTGRGRLAVRRFLLGRLGFARFICGSQARFSGFFARLGLFSVLFRFAFVEVVQ